MLQGEQKSPSFSSLSKILSFVIGTKYGRMISFFSKYPKCVVQLGRWVDWAIWAIFGFAVVCILVWMKYIPRF